MDAHWVQPWHVFNFNQWPRDESAEPVTGPNEEEACRHQGRPTHDQSLDRREIAQEDDQSVTPGRWHQAQEHHRGNGYRHRIVVESFLRTSPAYTHIETSPEVVDVAQQVKMKTKNIASLLNSLASPDATNSHPRMACFQN